MITAASGLRLSLRDTPLWADIQMLMRAPDHHAADSLALNLPQRRARKIHAYLDVPWKRCRRLDNAHRLVNVLRGAGR